MTNYPLFIHLELTNKCQKKCWMCGRRKIEKDYPYLANFNKNMDFNLVKKIAQQLPKNTIVHMHNNGEPLLYPKLKQAIKQFKHCITHFDTNAILLLDKKDDIINNLDILTISVIENDPLGIEQFEIVKEFLKIKKDKKPRVVFRLLGEVSTPQIYTDDLWYPLAKKYNCIIATRAIHSPMGSYNYTKKVTIPEYGICQEILTHMSIDVDGDVFPCVRFNPFKLNKIGSVKESSIINIWNSKKRLKLLKLHIKGERNKIELCNKCDYWGIPIG